MNFELKFVIRKVNNLRVPNTNESKKEKYMTVRVEATEMGMPLERLFLSWLISIAIPDVEMKKSTYF